MHTYKSDILIGLSNIPECLQNIRDYLDQDGAILSGHQEFITYFALPFVSEPENHPSFKHLFEVSKLKYYFEYLYLTTI